MASSRADRVVILVLDALGPEFIDADPRVRVPTLLDRAKAAGRRTAIAASDPDILNTVNGHAADLAWPTAADIDRHGSPRPKYLPDAATAETLVAAIRSNHDLIVGQLQGIDAAETRAARAELDDIVGALGSALADAWNDTLFVIVSDHRAENVASTDPVRLADALAGLADVIEDGSAALVRPRVGKLAAVLASVTATAGVDGACPLDGEHLVAWCEPGR